MAQASSSESTSTTASGYEGSKSGDTASLRSHGSDGGSNSGSRTSVLMERDPAPVFEFSPWKNAKRTSIADLRPQLRRGNSGGDSDAAAAAAAAARTPSAESSPGQGSLGDGGIAASATPLLPLAAHTPSPPVVLARHPERALSTSASSASEVSDSECGALPHEPLDSDDHRVFSPSSTGDAHGTRVVSGSRLRPYSGPVKATTQPLSPLHGASGRRQSAGVGRSDQRTGRTAGGSGVGGSGAGSGAGRASPRDGKVRVQTVPARPPGASPPNPSPGAQSRSRRISDKPDGVARVSGGGGRALGSPSSVTAARSPAPRATAAAPSSGSVRFAADAGAPSVRPHRKSGVSGGSGRAAGAGSGAGAASGTASSTASGAGSAASAASAASASASASASAGAAGSSAGSSAGGGGGSGTDSNSSSGVIVLTAANGSTLHVPLSAIVTDIASLDSAGALASAVSPVVPVVAVSKNGNPYGKTHYVHVDHVQESGLQVRVFAETTP